MMRKRKSSERPHNKRLFILKSLVKILMTYTICMGQLNTTLNLRINQELIFQIVPEVGNYLSL